MTFGEFTVGLVVSVIAVFVVSFAIGTLSYGLAELIRRRMHDKRR